MIRRCEWAGNDPLYIEYHDREWGVPLYDDRKIFEFLILETFQAGLSWITILKKRDNFRKALDDFDFLKIAGYTESDIARLMSDPGIIRNKLKIMATISNARAFKKVRNEFRTFSNYAWSFTGGKPVVNRFLSTKELPASTAISEKFSNDLRKRGFKFTGPTVVYAHMQATGMVNDHVITCFRHNEISDQKWNPKTTEY